MSESASATAFTAVPPPPQLAQALDAWAQLLGRERVLTGARLQRYHADTTGTQRHIPAALRVDDPAALPDVLRIAQRHGVPVYPISTGHNWGYGTALPARSGCVILDLGGMNRILDFDPELGVVTLEPGVTQGMLADFLTARQHPFLVPVTGAGPTCSLLANALERGYGVTPYTDHFGALTDLEAVLADGSLYRTALREAGSDELARLFKWGIGPYSAGLFTQSGLGVVTRVTLALARRPACIKACLFSLPRDDLLEPGVEAIRRAIGLLPGTLGGLNLMNRHRVLSMAAPFPADRVDERGVLRSEAVEALGKQYQAAPWTGLATLYGTPGMVRAAQRELKRELGPLASRLLFLSPQRARQLAGLARLLPGAWGRGLQGLTATLAQSLQLVAGRPNETALPLAYWKSGIPPQGGQASNPGTDGCGLRWYAPLVPMRGRDVRRYVNMVHEVAPKHGMEPLITFTSLGDRLFDSTVPLIFDRNQPQQVAAAAACYQELLHTGRQHGWFPYRVGVDSMDTLMGLQDHARRFHDRLRQALDPNDILAPGRYR